MSGIKPQALTELYRSLHARGLTTEIMAAGLGVSGGALRRMISGHRAPRGPIWKGFLELLTTPELQLIASVEQSSTWNRRRRPIWTPEVARKIAQSKAA